MSQTSGLPPVYCTICTELFLFWNQTDASQLIAAAPCGHTFHLNCLNQWLANSSTCPQCRTSTRKKTAVRLFFDLSTSALEDSDMMNQLKNANDGTVIRLNARVNELNDQLQAKGGALEKARTEAGRLAEQLASAKTQYCKVKTNLEEEKSKTKLLKQRLEDLTVRSDKSEELVKQNEKLAQKLHMLDSSQKLSIEGYFAMFDNEAIEIILFFRM